MSTQTLTPAAAAAISREDRHARQGVEAAARTLTDLAASGRTGEDAVAFLTDAADRVEQGPAPAAFKRAYAATLDTATAAGL